MDSVVLSEKLTEIIIMEQNFDGNSFSINNY